MAIWLLVDARNTSLDQVEMANLEVTTITLQLLPQPLIWQISSKLFALG